MDYFNEVLTTSLGLERVSCVAVYAAERSWISSKISSFVVQRRTKYCHFYIQVILMKVQNDNVTFKLKTFVKTLMSFLPLYQLNVYLLNTNDSSQKQKKERTHPKLEQ